jgi:hypothetical protein
VAFSATSCEEYWVRFLGLLSRHDVNEINFGFGSFSPFAECLLPEKNGISNATSFGVTGALRSLLLYARWMARCRGASGGGTAGAPRPMD